MGRKIILDEDEVRKGMEECNEEVKYWEERYRVAPEGGDKNSCKRMATIWLARFEIYRSILKRGEVSKNEK